MKNKVKVTEEQKILIERLNKLEGFKVDVISYVARKVEIPNPNYRPLAELTLEELLIVLYKPNSYEVIDPIQKGSFVRSKQSLNIYEVTDVNQKYAILKGIICKVGKNFTGSLPLHELELVTPEEIKTEKEHQLWKSIERKVGEFRKGDGLIDENGVIFHIGDTSNSEIGFITPSTASIWHSNGHMKGFFPVETFISFEEL